jgi:transcriptional antiterminator
MIKLENKLYSSTEVAEILGVSLRSVYRYLEEGSFMLKLKLLQDA